MNVGRSHRQTPVDDHYDVIVIGSGIAGLTCAALLALHRGWKVLVAEKHYTAGGYTHAFRRGPYAWDVGVHYIGQMESTQNEPRALFDHITGGALKWEDMGRVYDRAILGERVFDFPKGRPALRAALHDAFPKQGPVIDRYLKASARVPGQLRRLFMERALPRGLAWAGGLLRLGTSGYATRTTEAVLEEMGIRGELAGVLAAQWGDIGAPPSESPFLFHAVVAEHFMEGGAYPVGGATEIARTICAVIARAGGRVATRAGVSSILVENGRAIGVRLEDGTEVRSPRTISAAGYRLTKRFLPDGGPLWSPSIDACLEQIPASPAHVCLYLGLDATDEELALPRHNIWAYPSSDHRSNAALIDGLGPDAKDLPFTFISFPSAKNPQWTGGAMLEVVTIARWEDFRDFDVPKRRKDEAYQSFKERWIARLTRAAEAHVPQIRGHVHTAELSTPLSTRKFTNHPRGEIYGLAHTLDRLRPGPRVNTRIPGLFFTGVDLTGCGVAGGLAAGLITACAVARRNLIPRIRAKRSAPA